MALTLEDVITPATADEWLAKILSAATVLGLPVTAWQPGGIGRTILAVVAQMLAGADKVVSIIARAGFLKLAAAPDVTPDPSVQNDDGTFPPSGVGWLDLLADSLYNVQRIGPSTASNPMTLTNAALVAYGPFAPGQYHIANPVTKTTYSNVLPLTILAGGGTPTDTTALFQADIAGAGSNSAAFLVTQTVTSLVKVSIDPTKQTGAFGGANAESNAQLVQRCLDKLQALSPKTGPGGAYIFFAKSATQPPPVGGGLTISPITRAGVDTNPYDGTVILTVANSSGPPPPADLAALDAYLQAVVVPDAVTLWVQAATATPVLFTIEVWINASAAPGYPALVQAKIVDYLAQLDIGGTTFSSTAPTKGVPLSAIVDVAFNAAPADVKSAVVLLNGASANVPLGNTAVATLALPVNVIIHAV